MKVYTSIDFYIDKKIGKSHVNDHGLSHGIIFDFFENGRFVTQKRKDNILVSNGLAVLENGVEIVLKVVYKKTHRSNYYVITAYEIEDSQDAEFIKKEIESWEEQ